MRYVLSLRGPLIVPWPTRDPVKKVNSGIAGLEGIEDQAAYGGNSGIAPLKDGLGCIVCDVVQVILREAR